MSHTTHVRTLVVGEGVILHTGAAIKDEAGKSLVNASGIQIGGTWFFVDPYLGDDDNDGLTISTAFKNLRTAYNACTTGVGDGIVFISPRSTSAQTTSYTTYPFDWTKHGITVYGVAAPTRHFGRARVSNLRVTTGTVTDLIFVDGGTGDDYITDPAGLWITNGFAVGQKLRIVSTGAANDANFPVVTAVTAKKLSFATASIAAEAAGAGQIVHNYMDYLIDIQGDNNAFVNVDFANYDADPLSVGGVKVSGDRNYFGDCHFVGAGALPADRTGTANDRSLELVGAQDNTFVDCVTGSDLVDRGNHASCELLFTVDAGKPCERNRFEGCEFEAYVSTGTAHGALATSGATACRRDHVFKNCIFRVDTTAQAVVKIGTACTEGKFYMVDNTVACNYTAWEAAAGNMCRVAAPAAVASGGGGLVVIGTET
jgi:hypothetical protein